MEIRNTIGVGRGTMRLIIVSLVVVRMTVLTPGWLRYIWNNLHPPRDNAGRATGASGVRRGGRAPESFCQLLNKGLSNIVCSDVNSVSHTENNQRSFGGQRQA